MTEFTGGTTPAYFSTQRPCEHVWEFRHYWAGPGPEPFYVCIKENCGAKMMVTDPAIPAMLNEHATLIAASEQVLAANLKLVKQIERLEAELKLCKSDIVIGVELLKDANQEISRLQDICKDAHGKLEIARGALLESGRVTQHKGEVSDD